MDRKGWKTAYAAARKALRKKTRAAVPAAVKKCLAARQNGDRLAKIEGAKFDLRWFSRVET